MVRLLSSEGLENRFNEGRWSDPVGLGVVGGEHAMTEDRFGQAVHVIDAHVGTAFERRARLGSQDQVLAGAWTGAPGDILTDHLGRVGRVGTLARRPAARVPR